MRRNVMIVDDDPDLREMLTVYLEHAGFVVRSVKDGYTALEELRGNKFDLVVLDISIPHMNGFKVVKAMRASQEFKDIPVIMLTASDHPDDFLKVQGDVSDYVIKPPRRDNFIERVERILGGRPQFEEVFLDPADAAAHGLFQLPVRILSVSSRGINLSCPAPLPKNFVLETLQLGLLRTLNLAHRKFTVADCRQDADGTYSFYISFLGLSSDDQKKVADWVMETSFKAKNPTAKKAEAA